MNLSDVQDRSRRVFTELLRDRGRAPEAAAARPPTPAATAAARAVEEAPLPVRFSVFDPAQAAAASELALGLSVLAAASSDLAEGLDAALTQATQAAQTQDPELVHHAAQSHPAPLCGAFGLTRDDGGLRRERRLPTWREVAAVAGRLLGEDEHLICTC